MPISFAQIPSNIKVPLYWVEVDPSMAGLPSLNLRGLLVGTMLAKSQKVGTAVVAPTFAGTGYVVGNTISLGDDVVLTVATVTTGAVATVTITNAGAHLRGRRVADKSGRADFEQRPRHWREVHSDVG